MGDQQPVQVPLRQQRNNESLQIINTRGGALVRIGDEQQVSLPLLPSMEHQMDRVNGLFESFRLARIQAKKNVAIQGAIAGGELDVIRATIASQSKALIRIVEGVARAHEVHTLQLVKNFVEERLRQAVEQAHLAMQRAFLRVIVAYAGQLELIVKQNLPAQLQELALTKAREVFDSQWQEMAAVEFKV